MTIIDDPDAKRPPPSGDPSPSRSSPSESDPPPNPGLADAGLLDVQALRQPTHGPTVHPDFAAEAAREAAAAAAAETHELDSMPPPPAYTPCAEPPPGLQEQETIADSEAHLRQTVLALPDIERPHSVSQDDHHDDDPPEVDVSAMDVAQIHQVQGPRPPVDWPAMLGLGTNTLGAATSASTLGFAAARGATSFGLNFAKRITQGLVALPAMAIDGAATGVPPGGTNNAGPTVAQLAHSAVGGFFDSISLLALGGIDVGSAITGAGLGAAAVGVEGVRRTMGSEVLRSLAAFGRLVQREWNAADDALPPGGIPAYSALAVTRALTAWVCIQLVTRKSYERKMVKELDEVDIEALEREIALESEHAAPEGGHGEELGIDRTSGTLAVAGAHAYAPREVDAHADADMEAHTDVRITSEQALTGPDGEGDIIGAEIGTINEAPSSANFTNNAHEQGGSESASHPHPAPLSTREVLRGCRRYSKLVLGIYGGVALAWFGLNIPPGAEDPLDAEAPRVHVGAPVASAVPGETRAGEEPVGGTTNAATATQTGPSRAQDEADFLHVASRLDDPDQMATRQDEEEDAEEDIMPGAFSRVQQAQSQAAPGTPADALPSPAVLSAEQVVAGSCSSSSGTPSSGAPSRTYSYLDLIRGRHDDEVLHRLGGLPSGAAEAGSYDEVPPPSASASARPSAPVRTLRDAAAVARPSRPRYYVVTDHPTRRIILVLRGTLSVGDLAADLTCESVRFEHDERVVREREGGERGGREESAEQGEGEEDGPAFVQSEHLVVSASKKGKSRWCFDVHAHSCALISTRPSRQHEGMYVTAKEIGDRGRPVNRAVARALARNPEYGAWHASLRRDIETRSLTSFSLSLLSPGAPADLELIGHSLGAGIAAVLALMWSDRLTCLTLPSSGLPGGRKVHAFCFGTPCVTTAALAQESASLITTFVYSFDLVSRLSLGAIQDIRNAAAWLCYSDSESAAAGETGPTAVRTTTLISRAFEHQAGRFDSDPSFKEETEEWFLSVRKTLEANMLHVHLLPPGDVYLCLANGDLSEGGVGGEEKPQGGAQGRSAGDRLFRVRPGAKRENVFGQIIFWRKMLATHMPDV